MAVESSFVESSSVALRYVMLRQSCSVTLSFVLLSFVGFGYGS